MFSRPQFRLLQERLAETPDRLLILAGPRQVGKTTLIGQLHRSRPPGSSTYVAADAPSADQASAMIPAFGTVAVAPGRQPDRSWLVEQWRQAQRLARTWQASTDDAQPFTLAIDEIQKIPDWSSVIKGLWDAQMADGPRIHLVILGSSPLLMQRGLTESLAGRFEVVRLPHWSFAEMSEAFGLTLDAYVYFGGYPGSAAKTIDEARWRDYVVSSLIAPNIDRDILQMTRVEKPALLRQLFEIGCLYSGQIVSLDKMLGQLCDAGNVTTLARYLDLLGEAGLLTGLQKFANQALRRRNSPPKFQALNNAFLSALGSHSLGEAHADRSHWGRLVESTVGAHLCNTAGADAQVHYWRDAGLEVDFVVEHRGRLAAVEVKSGKLAGARRGMAEFLQRHPGARAHVVGGDELPLGEFLRYPATHWV